MSDSQSDRDRSTEPSINGAPLPGRAYLSKSSRQVAAELHRRDDELLLLDASGHLLTRSTISAVQVDPRLANAERRVTFPDGMLFVTADHAAFERLCGQHAATELYRHERFGPRLMAVAGLCLAGAWVVWKYGLTLLVAIAVWLTPDPLIRAIDSGMMQAVDQFMTGPTQLDDAGIAQAETVFKDLVQELEPAQADTEYRLLFRQMPGDIPNAFALPGGTIVVTDALVEMASNDVLASVLGHEIGHVEKRHGLRQVYRSVGTFILISMLAGDTGPILEDLLLEGNLILSLAYSRRHELEADGFGVRLARDAGYDPNGLKQFFDTLQDRIGNDSPNWLSTHPDFDERRRELNAILE